MASGLIWVQHYPCNPEPSPASRGISPRRVPRLQLGLESVGRLPDWWDWVSWN